MVKQSKGAYAAVRILRSNDLRQRQNAGPDLPVYRIARVLLHWALIPEAVAMIYAKNVPQPSSVESPYVSSGSVSNRVSRCRDSR